MVRRNKKLDVHQKEDFANVLGEMEEFPEFSFVGKKNDWLGLLRKNWFKINLSVNWRKDHKEKREKKQ